MARVNPFRWSTRDTDDETDLLMYPARPYSPSTGRFLCRDPLGEIGGNNLYSFVRNDPVNRIDPFGLIDENSTVEEIEAEVALLFQDARNRGMNVAADMLQNYVNGGGDQVLSVSWLRSFSRVRNAERKNQKRFEESLRKIAAETKCDETRTFTDYWDALISYSGRGFSSEELF